MSTDYPLRVVSRRMEQLVNRNCVNRAIVTEKMKRNSYTRQVIFWLTVRISPRWMAALTRKYPSKIHGGIVGRPIPIHIGYTINRAVIKSLTTETSQAELLSAVLREPRRLYFQQQLRMESAKPMSAASGLNSNYHPLWRTVTRLDGRRIRTIYQAVVGRNENDNEK